MEHLFTIAASILFIIGLLICLLNIYIAQHNLREGANYSSMIPVIASLFMAGAVWLQVRTAEPPWEAMLPFLLLDVSTLPALLMLPFYGLARLLPKGIKLALLLLYVALVGCVAVTFGLSLFTDIDTSQLPLPL